MGGLIERGAALKALAQIREALWGIDIPSPTVPEYIEHHMDVQEMMKRVDELRGELEALPSEREWIPCSERLPETRGEYMVTVEYYSLVEKKTTRCLLSSAYTKTNGWRLSEGKVVAWMPLPDLYWED